VCVCGGGGAQQAQDMIVVLCVGLLRSLCGWPLLEVSCGSPHNTSCPEAPSRWPPQGRRCLVHPYI